MMHPEPKPLTKGTSPDQLCSVNTSIDTLITMQSEPTEAGQIVSHSVPTTIRAVQDCQTKDDSRSLIICLDGTGDQFDDDNSNVVNFVACLKKDHPQQVTYYQSGIGTYNERGLRNGIAAAIDMSVGSGLGIHVKDAYRFLMQNYRERDKICLFGFSRGSYTVRCLAGMLHKVGLLPAHNRAQVNFAYNFYKDDSPEGWIMSSEFKKTFCADVNVYFVGVWDSVASVGFIPRKLPLSKSPTNNIQYFRHAMALDEHRSKFKILHYANDDPSSATKFSPNRTRHRTGRWLTKKHGNEAGSETEAMKTTAKARKLLGTKVSSVTHNPALNEVDSEQPTQELKTTQEAVNRTLTDVLEVWFCGGHADIGGGAVKNWERHVLARIPLRWMIRQCFECNTGIFFKTATLAETGIDVPSLWPTYKFPKRPVVGPSPTHLNCYAAGNIAPLQRRSTALDLINENPESQTEEDLQKEKFEVLKKNQEEFLPEQAEDYFDAMAPINDQLKLAKGWWILEFWPVKVRRQKLNSDDWEKVVRFNMGRYRSIRELEPKMHWTVDQRIRDKGYKIQAVMDRDAVWKIVP